MIDGTVFCILLSENRNPIVERHVIYSQRGWCEPEYTIYHIPRLIASTKKRAQISMEGVFVMQ